jgi:hypothetical protein
VRRLIRAAQDYEIEKRCFILAIRQKDQAQDLLIAPPADDPDAGARLSQAAIQAGSLLSSEAAVLASQDRLIALWAEYQAGRMALDRDLGIVPFTSWDDFRQQLMPPLPPPPVQPKEGPLPPAPPPPPSEPQ